MALGRFWPTQRGINFGTLGRGFSLLQDLGPWTMAPEHARPSTTSTATPSGSIGRTIGILEFGAGYRTSDIQNYFLGIAALPIASVAFVPIEGGVRVVEWRPGKPDIGTVRN